MQENNGSKNSGQLRAVPEAAGLWTTQVPPPGTGSGQAQDPRGPKRNRTTGSATSEKDKAWEESESWSSTAGK
eukprot:10180930-Heterocapsa_arctica.AAC.1